MYLHQLTFWTKAPRTFTEEKICTIVSSIKGAGETEKNEMKLLSFTMHKSIQNRPRLKCKTQNYDTNRRIREMLQDIGLNKNFLMWPQILPTMKGKINT